MGQKNLVGLQGNPCFEWFRIRIRGFYIYVNAYVGHIDNYGVADDCDYDDDVLDDGDVVFVDNNDDDEDYFPVERRQTAFASDPSKNLLFPFT